jgi:hypothetical protein
MSRHGHATEDSEDDISRYFYVHKSVSLLEHNDLIEFKNKNTIISLFERKKVLAKRGRERGKVCLVQELTNDATHLVMKEMLLISEDVLALWIEMYNLLRPLEHPSLMKYHDLFYVPEKKTFYATMVRTYVTVLS